MTRSEMVRLLALKTGITQPQAHKMIDAFLGLVELSLSLGENVKLHGFGKFEVRQRSAVKRINPRNGELLDIPAKRTVGFLPSPLLKERVNGQSD